jgi:hypothetical protein
MPAAEVVVKNKHRRERRKEILLIILRVQFNALLLSVTINDPFSMFNAQWPLTSEH